MGVFRTNLDGKTSITYRRSHDVASSRDLPRALFAVNPAWTLRQETLAEYRGVDPPDHDQQRPHNIAAA